MKSDVEITISNDQSFSLFRTVSWIWNKVLHSDHCRMTASMDLININAYTSAFPTEALIESSAPKLSAKKKNSLCFSINKVCYLMKTLVETS